MIFEFFFFILGKYLLLRKINRKKREEKEIFKVIRFNLKLNLFFL
jgi:hypothetical protein